MRILCVITNLDTGGAQRQLVNLARGLKRRGHHVEFFTYYPQGFFKPELDQADIPVHLCLKKSRYALTPVWELRRRIRCGSFDVVLAFLETAVVYAELACLGMPGVHLIASERNCDPNAAISFGRAAKSRLHQLARTVVVNSHAHRDWMAAHFTWLNRRLVTIWNGVDTEVFRPAGNASNNGTLKLFGVGRITPQKNLPALAQALAECSGKKVAVTLDWAGKPDDLSCHRAVLAAIKNHRVEDVWRWLGVRKDIPALLNQYDALILPSLWEGLPNCLCEALAAGLPVLASDVSDNARLVQGGVTGFVFDPKRPSAIARAITQFAFLDQSTRRSFRLAARSFAEKELSLAACVANYERLLMADRQDRQPA
jgi:glycosyltransferase involved in cell wall biosynthesis